MIARARDGVDALRAHRRERLSTMLGWRGGGAGEDRTPDLLIANEALSQLSYGPATNPDRTDPGLHRSGASWPTGAIGRDRTK
jgi:hypothetical protein